MDLEQQVKNALLLRGFSEKTLLNNRGLIGATIDETMSLFTRKVSSSNLPNKEWISVNELPSCSMKVKWKCEDGIEDVGFYYKEQNQFASFDLLTQSPITHWKPL